VLILGLKYWLKLTLKQKYLCMNVTLKTHYNSQIKLQMKHASCSNKASPNNLDTNASQYRAKTSYITKEST